MLDIGLQEILLILAIALLVFGPKRLPELGRALGRAMREFRRASDEFRSTLETNLQLNEPDPTPSAATISEPPPPPVVQPVGAPRSEAGPSIQSESEPAVVSGEPYVAQRGAHLFHGRECTWAGRIGEADRLYFKRVSEAVEQGFAKCPVCEPWEPE
jgi:TatA/E family protein of Tat protein translocase